VGNKGINVGNKGIKVGNKGIRVGITREFAKKMAEFKPNEIIMKGIHQPYFGDFADCLRFVRE